METELGRLKPRRKRERMRIVRWKRRDSVKQRSTIGNSISFKLVAYGEGRSWGHTEEDILHDDGLACQDSEGVGMGGISRDFFLDTCPGEVDVEEEEEYSQPHY